METRTNELRAPLDGRQDARRQDLKALLQELYPGAITDDAVTVKLRQEEPTNG